jgi:hypothetical protein
MGRGNSRRQKKKRDAKARRAVAVAMDQQEKENKEGTEPPPDTAMGGTGVATGLGQVNEDETKLPIGSGETKLQQGDTEPPPDTALRGTGVATDLEEQTEEHHGNSGGEHLPAAGFAPEQPDEYLWVKCKEDVLYKSETRSAGNCHATPPARRQMFSPLMH